MIQVGITRTGFTISCEISNKRQNIWNIGTENIGHWATNKQKKNPTGIHGGQKSNEETPMNASLTCWRKCTYCSTGRSRARNLEKSSLCCSQDGTLERREVHSKTTPEMCTVPLKYSTESWRMNTYMRKLFEAGGKTTQKNTGNGTVLIDHSGLGITPIPKAEWKTL